MAEGEQKPQEPIPGVSTRIVDLSVPSFVSKLPFPENQIFRLAFPLSERAAMHGLQRGVFQRRSNTVVVPCSSADLGLGDSFNNLRYALLLAEKSPEKQVVIHVPHALTKVDMLDVPQNARIVSEFPEELLEENDVFVLQFEPDLAGSKGYILPEHMWRKLEEWQKDGRYATARNFVCSSSTLLEELGLDEEELYNINDVVNTARLVELGVPVEQADIAKPITHISSQDLEANPIHHDLLIVSDAGEWEHNGRSLKSLSPQKWSEVFALLPSSLKLGIVIGHTHPQYTMAVLREAQKRGFSNVEQVDTPTFDDFIRAVLQSKKYVGGDTGPSHIARDAVKAAKNAGRDIAFRQFFEESSILPLDEYGTVGRGEDGKILVINTESGDLDSVDAVSVAQFILQ